ncbi:MAG: cohesin domain-containing protein [Gammaproteobacteria bacterium]
MKKHARQTVQLVLGTFLLVTVGGANAATVGFGPASIEVGVGSTFDVEIRASDFVDLVGGRVDLGYNGDVLGVRSVVVDSYWDFDPISGNRDENDPGRWEGIRFDSFDNDPLQGDGLIATVTFAAQAVGQSAIDILDSSQFLKEDSVLFAVPVTLDGSPVSAQVTVVPTVVPLPAALPLLLSALGLIGWMKARGSKTPA